MSELNIGDLSRNGLYQVTDTNWDHNGTLRVTVREMVGVPLAYLTAKDIRAMRDLARRAIAHPNKTRSAKLVNKWHAQGGCHATFAVSRLP
jgi:hypothetical protein